MTTTKIEWAEKTWNPITGCTKISEGCLNCYAERMSRRMVGRFGYSVDAPFQPGTVHPDQFEKPVTWKKSSLIFVCSMGDLFHEAVTDDQLMSVFRIIFERDVHIYLILTKRPERMADFFKAYYAHDWLQYNPHVWLGVTTETQEQADKRIPVLLQVPAAVRFVSVEPMLDYVDLTAFLKPAADRLDWVICGGETGHGSRPMSSDWARSMRRQCAEAEIPFFFKKHGDWWCKHFGVGPKCSGNRELDGRRHEEYPHILQHMDGKGLI